MSTPEPEPGAGHVCRTCGLRYPSAAEASDCAKVDRIDPNALQLNRWIRQEQLRLRGRPS